MGHTQDIRRRTGTTVVLLNQTRDNVGVMFGPKKRTPAGNAPHFYASIELMLSAAPRPDHGYVRGDPPAPLSQAAVKRLGLYGIADKEAKGAVVGRYIRAKCTKTKVAVDSLESVADFYIDFRRGVHAWEGLMERLLFERRVTTDEDGVSNVAIVGNKFATKKEWLNWTAAHLAKGEFKEAGLAGLVAAEEESDANGTVPQA